MLVRGILVEGVIVYELKHVKLLTDLSVEPDWVSLHLVPLNLHSLVNLSFFIVLLLGFTLLGSLEDPLSLDFSPLFFAHIPRHINNFENLLSLRLVNFSLFALLLF